ncbi:MAG: addiction module protein [Planctomycetaceae bacterium]|jgi:putative addiction module component (TIGR02574 family)
MDTNHSELLQLPPSEQLRIVEMLWDNLGSSTDAIPLPEWVDREGRRRMDEMIADPTLGSDGASVWRNIESRNG